MSVNVLISGFLVFIACLAVHVVVWRVRRPSNPPVALAVIFFVLSPLPGFLIARYLPGLAAGISAGGWAAVYLLHVSLSCAYIMSYPAVEAVSPSLVIALMLGRAGERGVASGEIERFFASDVVLAPRFRDLVDSGFASESGGAFTLTPRGRAIIRFFILFRRIMGLPEGGG